MSDRRKSFSNSNNKISIKDKDKGKENFKLKEFVSKSKCTYYLYGKQPVNQIEMFCNSCDLTAPICAFCYDSCHKNCTKRTRQEHETREFAFTCSCGIKKHLVYSKASKHKAQCELTDLDKKINNLHKYSCGNCQLSSLCSICYFECHQKLHCIEKKILDEDHYKDTSEIEACQCQYENHALYDKNEFTFWVVTSPTYIYEAHLPFMQPIQIINTLFDSNTALTIFFNYFKKSFDMQKIDRRSRNYAFINRISIFCAPFRSNFKSYYYHQKILELFPYQIMLSIILKYGSDATYEQIYLKYQLYYIVLFVHLKRDFQLIKCFSIHDFFHTSPLDRIFFRKSLLTSTTSSKHLHDKYLLVNSSNNEEDVPLKTLIIKIAESMEKDYNLFKIQEYKNDYHCCLRIIYFALKRYIFDMADLKKLIIALDKFHVHFHFTLNEHSGNFETYKDLLFILIKIFYVISTAYNDLVMNEILEESEKKSKKFINYKSEHGNKLFKMIIKTSNFFSQNFENTKQIDTNILKIFNETLKIFNLAENVFNKQLNHIDNEEALMFFKNLEKFEIFAKHGITNYNFVRMFTQNSTKKELREFKSASFEERESESVLWLYKQKLEKSLETYFLFQTKEDLCENFLAITEDFITQIPKTYRKTQATKKMSSINSSESNRDLVSVKEQNIDMKIQSNRFRLKIIKMISRFLSFVTDQTSTHVIDAFIEEMIYSNLDDTLTKLFYFLNSDQSKNDRCMDIILSFLLLLCLSKKGMKVLVKGKNLTRIFHHIDKNPSRILRFLYVLCKGLHIYKIDIQFHKGLPSLRDRLINNMEQYSISTDKENLHFKIQFIQTIKIFFFLAKNFEFEEFNAIKYRIINIFTSKGLLEKAKFMKIFPEKMFIHQNTASQFDENGVLNMNYVHADAGKPHELDLIKTKFLQENKGSFNINVVKPNDVAIYNKNKIKTISQNKNSQAPSLLEEENMKDFDDSASFTLKITNYNKFKIPNKPINPFNHDLDLLSNICVEDTNVDHKLYFSFFNLIPKFTYFVYDNKDNFKEMLEFDDLETYKNILNKNFLSLTHRTIFLNYLRTMYFIDVLDKEDYSKRYKYLTTVEHQQFLKGENKSEELIQKEKTLMSVKTIIEIFAQEIKNFTLFIYIEQEDIEDVEAYLRMLLLSVKTISDFFYLEKYISNHMTLYFYQLVRVFLKKSNTLKNLLKAICSSESIYQLDISDKAHPRLNEMKKYNFDLFDTDLMYQFIIESINEIFLDTGMHKKMKLSNLLQEYDDDVELDYQTKGIVSSKAYENFYEDDEEILSKKNLDHIHPKIIEVLKVYTFQFSDVENANFLKVFSSMSTEDSLDYKDYIVNYFVKIFSTEVYYPEDYLITALKMITKMLYYDTDNFQETLEFLLEEQPSDKKNNENNNFGNVTDRKNITEFLSTAREDKIVTKYVVKNGFYWRFYSELQETFVLNFVTAKNLFMYERYSKVINVKNKLMIQFLQLLAEGFNQKFQTHIFRTVSFDLHGKEILMNFWENIFSQFLVSFELMNVQSNLNSELPHDKLIILITNITEFMIEYIQGCNDQDYKIIADCRRRFFTSNIHLIIFSRIDEKNIIRKDLILYLKSKFIHLLVCFIHDGRCDKSDITQILKNMSLISLFEEVQVNLWDLVKIFISKGILDADTTLSDRSIVASMIDLYTFNQEFQTSTQLNVCFHIYELLRILSDIYQITTIKDYFKSTYNVSGLSEDSGAKKTKLDKKKDPNVNFFSIAAFRTYTFLESVILKVEIRRHGKDYFSFFVKPPLCFLLSTQTKNSFFENVERDSAYTKLNNLLDETDYFIFEMFYNNYLMRGGNIIARKVKNLKFFWLELINFLFIVLHQFLLIGHFHNNYKENDERFLYTNDEKYKIHLDNMIVGIIQTIFLAVTLSIWLYYKYPLYFQHKIMSIYNKPFVFDESTGIKKFLKNFDLDPSIMKKVIGILNSDVSLWRKIHVSLFDTIIYNREINIFILSFFLLITYFLTGSALCLVFPILNVSNLSEILFNIILAVQLRWQQLVTVLIFTYLVVYCFMWITFYYIYESFMFDGVMFDQYV